VSPLLTGYTSLRVSGYLSLLPQKLNWSKSWLFWSNEYVALSDCVSLLFVFLTSKSCPFRKKRNQSPTWTYESLPVFVVTIFLHSITSIPMSAIVFICFRLFICLFIRWEVYSTKRVIHLFISFILFYFILFYFILLARCTSNSLNASLLFPSSLDRRTLFPLYFFCLTD
jgi:hypothetical protein